MSTADELRAVSARANDDRRKAADMVRDLRRLLGQAMAAEATANRIAREAAKAAASA